MQTPQTTRSIRLPTALHDAARDHAERQGITLNRLIRNLLEKETKREGK